MSQYIRDDNFSKNKYILYARKSTESDDRQVASIKDQIAEMLLVAKELNIKQEQIIIKSEASSGFHTGRTVFNEVVGMIEKGEADSLLVWKLSRLSRNAEDAGRIMHMLQNKVIKHIRTCDRNWYPEDNVMMMYVEFGATNQFSKDLSADTSRGLRRKAERGWSPKSALPLGYLHTPYKKTTETEIISDRERLDIISKTLTKIATGELRIPEALVYANQLGLTTKKGQKIGRSTFYRIISDPFYYGKFEFPEGSGNWYEGKHEKAITEEEYNLVRKYRGRKDAPRPQKHLFAYTGLMKCGECGCSIVVDPKVKVQKNGKTHKYLYYRCTKSKGNCSQKYLELDEFEKQLSEIIGNVEIPDVFHEWAMQELQKDVVNENKDREQIYTIAKNGYEAKVKELVELVTLKLQHKVSEDIFEQSSSKLEAERDKYKKLLDNTDSELKKWVKKIDEAMTFSQTAKAEFEAGGLHKKNEILTRLGTNIVIQDLKLHLEVEKPLVIINKATPYVNTLVKRFEPQNSVSNKEKLMIFMSENPKMGQCIDSILKAVYERVRVMKSVVRVKNIQFAT